MTRAEGKIDDSGDEREARDEATDQQVARAALRERRGTAPQRRSDVARCYTGQHTSDKRK